MILKKVVARVVKDSRGRDTIGVRVNNGPEASAPAGSSVSGFASPLWYGSLKESSMILNTWDLPLTINSFSDLTKLEATLIAQHKLKRIEDFGANVLMAFEGAVLKALAKEQKKSVWELINPRARKMPRPVGNVAGGGLHTDSRGAVPDFQEFLIIPREKTFRANVSAMQAIHRKLKNYSTKIINDEGAWIIPMREDHLLDLLAHMVHRHDFDCDLGLDVAANSLYEDGKYYYSTKHLRRTQHAKQLLAMTYKYNLHYVEDPLQERDMKGFATFTKNAPKKTLIVGDDLIATQPERLAKAIAYKAINAIIVKPNQHGSLLTVREIIKLCKKNGIKTIMSHRSGETLDNVLADYAFGMGVDYVKFGVATKWRTAKLNRMVAIERSLKK